MTLQSLAYKEDDLYSKVIDLYHQTFSSDTDKKLSEIFSAYKKIHRAYANFSSFDIEALKRGLFIQWYAIAEPNYLTGIGELDESTEAKIIEDLNNFILTKKIDYELTWMLNYYARWNWIFDRIKSFKGFDKAIVNQQNDKLPDLINRESMNLRGQMGKYWNSLIKFKSV